jgi:hypothetical protein
LLELLFYWGSAYKMPNLDQIQSFISNLGFPIFMSLYFMWAQQKAAARHDKVLEELDCVQTQLNETKIQMGSVLPAAAVTIAKANQAEEGVKK